MYNLFIGKEPIEKATKTQLDVFRESNTDSFESFSSARNIRGNLYTNWYLKITLPLSKRGEE